MVGRVHRNDFQSYLHHVVRLRPVVRCQLPHLQGRLPPNRRHRMSGRVDQLYNNDQHNDNNNGAGRRSKHMVRISIISTLSGNKIVPEIWILSIEVLRYKLGL